MDQPSSLQTYLDFAHRLADAAAAVTRPYFRTRVDITDKSGKSEVFDPVTRADREAEQAIRALIQQNYPDHGIFGEEFGQENGASRLTWVIDPIDGTRSFISGLPLWGTLIALHDGDRPVIGIMDQPISGERFSGGPEGSFLNGQRLQTRTCPDLAQAAIATTDPGLFPTASHVAAYRQVADRACYQRLGLDCYAYCMVALGFLDLVVEGGLKPYDIQALIPIIEGAGGVVTDWRGGRADQGGNIVAAGDRRVHEQVLEILSKA